jgi:hypothetical protein
MSNRKPSLIVTDWHNPGFTDASVPVNAYLKNPLIDARNPEC